MMSSLREEGDGYFVGHLLILWSAYRVSSVLTSIEITSLLKEGDGRFVGHLLILWKVRIMLTEFCLAL